MFHEIGPEIFSDEYGMGGDPDRRRPLQEARAPLLFGDQHDDIWYLFLDQYGHARRAT